MDFRFRRSIQIALDEEAPEGVVVDQEPRRFSVLQFVILSIVAAGICGYTIATSIPPVMTQQVPIPPAVLKPTLASLPAANHEFSFAKRHETAFLAFAATDAP